MVNTTPCFRSPYKNSGMFNTSKKRDSDSHSGVSCDNKIDVPEIPLSYRSTGAINIVTPKAFTIPAIVRKRKFFHFSFPSCCFKVMHKLLSFSVCAVSSHFLRFSFFSLLPYLYQIPSVFRHSGKYVIHFLTQIARSHTQRRLPHSTS